VNSRRACPVISPAFFQLPDLPIIPFPAKFGKRVAPKVGWAFEGESALPKISSLSAFKVFHLCPVLCIRKEHARHFHDQATSSPHMENLLLI
jgi:hypothetical protein